MQAVRNPVTMEEKKGSRKEFQAYSKKPLLSQWHVLPFVTVVYPFVYWVYVNDSDEEQAFFRIALICAVLLHVVAIFGRSWSTKYRAKSTLIPCSLMSPSASLIHVTTSKAFAKNQLCPVTRRPDGTMEIVYCEKKMIFNPDTQRFESPKFPVAMPVRTYLEDATVGLEEDSIPAKKEIFGRNVFEMNAPTFMQLFKQHASAPFFVFQLVCSAFWMLDDYWKTSCVSIAMLVFMEAQQVWQRLRDINQIHEMRPDDPILLHVLRDGQWVKVSSAELLPLDVVAVARRAESVPVEPSKRLLQLRAQMDSLRASNPNGQPPGFMMNVLRAVEAQEAKRQEKRDAAAGIGPDADGVVLPCDALLLAGSLVMNEASLTGESVPQRKEGLLTLVQAAGSQQAAAVLNAPLAMKGAHKGFIAYAGTRVVLHESPEQPEEGAEVPALVRQVLDIPPPPVEHAAIVRVLRTGAHTTQGKIVRMILSSSERVSADGHKEAFLFLAGLCLLAAGAIYYVVTHTLQDETRSRFKLFISSAHILMAVVPPDFAVMLSCATTMSLMKLFQLKIYCTEPFRVPIAGKVQLCAFDKTGTITSDEMEALGVFAHPKYPPPEEVLARSRGSQAEQDEMLSKSPLDDETEELERAKQLVTKKPLEGDLPSPAPSTVSLVGKSKEERKLIKQQRALAAKAAQQPLAFETRAVLAACQSLVFVDGKLVGDGLELAGFHYCGGSSVKDLNTLLLKPHNEADPLAPCPPGEQDELSILRRFPFDSTLRRMTNVVKISGPANGWRTGRSAGAKGQAGIVVTKGAPSTIAALLGGNCHDFLEEASRLADKGFRVLALASKYIPTVEALNKAKNSQSRDEIESGLQFCGLLALACPIKVGARATLSRLRLAGNQLQMITGDAMLTACRVAADVALANPRKPWLELVPCAPGSKVDQSRRVPYVSLISGTISDAAAARLSALPSGGDEIESLVRAMPGAPENASEEAILADLESRFVWRRACDGVDLPVRLGIDDLAALYERYSLCVSGGVLGKTDGRAAARFAPFVSVFARTSPQQKELLLRACQASGVACLMCGDGTNDVGALKAAEVGVSIMNQPLEALVPPALKNQQQNKIRMAQRSTAQQPPQPAKSKLQEQLESQMAELQDMGGGLIRLGDASIAAPFSYAGSSLQCVGHLVRTGRAVQAAVVQLYMVTALSSLVCAISMSALRLDGLKTGDTQATLETIILMTLMMSVSNAPPAKALAPGRPPTSVFELPTLVSLLVQGVIHATCLLGGWYAVKQVRDPEYDPDIDGEFKPNDVNTVVFLLRNAVQASCFLANYEGAPFLLPIQENSGVKWGAIIALSSIAAIATDSFPEITELFECTSLARLPGLQFIILGLLAADIGLSFLVAHVCRLWRRANHERDQQSRGSPLVGALKTHFSSQPALKSLQDKKNQ